MTATATRPVAKKKPVTHIEQLAAQLADARAQRKLWKDKEAALVEKLVAAHAAGVAPTKFTTHGWSFSWRSGRETITYLPAIAAKIKKIQEAAKADGQFTVNVGKPFWEIVPAKEQA